jgi:hypothetical protein
MVNFNLSIACKAGFLKIGTNEYFIKLAQDTDQFLSGVFLALPQDHGEECIGLDRC